MLKREQLVERVRERGPRLREELEDALRDVPLVREVRGHGFLLGIEYADPRDGESFLPPELGVAGKIDATALEHGLIVLSTQPTRDGYAGDQSALRAGVHRDRRGADEMVERFAAVGARGVGCGRRKAPGRPCRRREGPMSDATTTGPDWRALVIQHERPTPPGLIEPWLRERGAEVEILRIDEEDPHDLNPQDYGLIVSPGSEFPAYEDSIRWISHEIDLLQAATDADVPILGVCFGGQLLALDTRGRSLPVGEGGDRVAPGRERTTQTSSPTDPGSSGTSIRSRFPTEHGFSPRTSVGPQAFSIGRSLGVQFHPEVTPEIMDAWVLAYRHELDEHGVDPDRLLEETHERSESARTTSRNLFDRFLERVARPRERA